MRGKAPRPGQSTIRNSGSRKHVAPPPQQRRAPASLKVTKPPGGADHVVVGTDKPALCATSRTQSKTAADPQARMQMKKQRAAGGSANLAKRSELSATPRKLHPSTPASHALAALRTTDAPTPARSALASDLAAALTMPPSNAPPAGQRVITLDLGARKLRYGDVGGRASFKIGAPGPGASKPRRLARPGPDFDRKERPQRPTRKQYDTRKNDASVDLAVPHKAEPFATSYAAHFDAQEPAAGRRRSSIRSIPMEKSVFDKSPDQPPRRTRTRPDMLTSSALFSTDQGLMHNDKPRNLSKRITSPIGGKSVVRAGATVDAVISPRRTVRVPVGGHSSIKLAWGE